MSSSRNCYSVGSLDFKTCLKSTQRVGLGLGLLLGWVGLTAIGLGLPLNPQAVKDPLSASGSLQPGTRGASFSPVGTKGLNGSGNQAPELPLGEMNICLIFPLLGF